MIAAGRLNKRVQIQQQVDIKNQVGHTAKRDWDTVATVWASITPISGREIMASQRELGEITHRIRMRFRSGITAKNRIVYRGRAFDIESAIDVEEKGVVLEMMCKEGVSNG